MDIRKIMREKRHKLSAEEKESAAHRLFENFLTSSLSFKSIAVYLPFDGEIDPTHIIHYCWENNKEAYLPVIYHTKIMQFAQYAPDTELEPNKFNILEPVNTKIISAEKLDLILVPIVAFDKNCNRVGMGQGYYDATLHHCRQSSFLLGLAYDFQYMNKIIPHTNDVKLNSVMTNKEIILYN